MLHHLQKLTVRFVLWGALFVLLASLGGFLLRRWLISFSAWDDSWDYLVIFPVLVGLLFLPIIAAFREWVLKPIALLVEYDRRATTDGIEAGLIPEEYITQDEIGAIMQTRNEMLEGLRGLQDLLAQEHSYMDAVVEGLREGVLLVDEMGCLLLSNPAAEAIFRKLDLSLPGRDGRLVSIGPFTIETLHLQAARRPEGLARVAVLGDEPGPFIELWAGRRSVSNHQVLLLALRDITEQLQYEQALKDLSLTDPLTGLPNRRSLFEAFPSEIARSRRYMTPLSLLMLDLDNFKHINDTYGHKAGDDALKLVASLISAVSRKTDLPARYAGDEFVVLLPHTTLEGAETFARRLLDSVLIVGQEDGSNLSISVGVAGLQEDDDAAGDSFLSRSDRALYVAKGEGGSRVSVAP